MTLARNGKRLFASRVTFPFSRVPAPPSGSSTRGVADASPSPEPRCAVRQSAEKGTRGLREDAIPCKRILCKSRKMYTQPQIPFRLPAPPKAAQTTALSLISTSLPPCTPVLCRRASSSVQINLPPCGTPPLHRITEFPLPSPHYLGTDRAPRNAPISPARETVPPRKTVHLPRETARPPSDTALLPRRMLPPPDFFVPPGFCMVRLARDSTQLPRRTHPPLVCTHRQAR